MFKLLARIRQEPCLFKLLWSCGTTLLSRGSWAPSSTPPLALAFLAPVVVAGRPNDWDPEFGISKDDGRNNSNNNLQKLKLLEHIKELVAAGRLDEAEKILEKAVETARRSHNMEWTNILLLILAKMAYNSKQYNKAEQHYIELNNNFNMPQEQSLLVKKLKVYTAFYLAKIYEVTKEFQKAEELYKHCISQIQVMNVGAEDYLWATSVLERVMDNYSLFLADRSHLKEALHYRNKVYRLVKLVHGPESERACYCLNELGRLSALLGQDDEAMDFLAQALRIGRKITLENRSMCAIYVNNGLLLMKKQMYSKAKEYCMEAKRLSRTDKDPQGNAQADVCLEMIAKEQRL